MTIQSLVTMFIQSSAAVDSGPSAVGVGTTMGRYSSRTRCLSQKENDILDTPLIVGYLASVCSVSSFVPQVVKVIRTGDTEAISARMYCLTVTGFVLWTTFGIMRSEWPIILTNAACFLLSAFILVKKLKRRR